MTGFVSSPPPSPTPDGEKIEAGPFWPDIDVNLFRDAMRVGGTTIADPRLKEALIGGIITADDNLTDWRAAQESRGFASLNDVPSPEIGGVRRLALLWRRAVFGFAAADLIETHRDVTATAAGATDADRIATTPADHRRNAIHAVRDIIGVTRTAVELI